MCLFDKTNNSTREIVNKCCEYVNSFNAIKASSHIVKMEEVFKWVPPPLGKVKLNFDGASFSHKGKIGVGIILRNHMGHVLYALSQKEDGVFEMDEIEFWQS
ncbi:hypothetical protein I3760_03G189800 [Carya illinoinensis]|nr:hypothetical protein I3760_03G189800 [Carya illinoinensis]